ncbi:MAG: restriction endonuclease subunit S [Thermodesulfobacteriota bacterium]
MKKIHSRKKYTGNKMTHFKQTKIGKIPKEWEVVSLGEIGELQYGYTSSAMNKNTGIKLLRITDIKDDGQVDWQRVPYCEVKNNDFEKYSLAVGDILFARIGATTGKTTYVDRELKGVFASYLIRFKPLNQNLNPKFLYYYSQSNPYWTQVHKNKEGQLKKGLNAKILATLKLPLPPLSEQKKIAEILSTVDKAVEKVDEAIEKTQRLKKGLMQELLTGRRNTVDGGQGRREFKQTEIGRVPREWEVRKVIDLFIVETGTTPSTKQREYWGNGKISWITPTDLSKLNGKIKIGNSKRKITKKALEASNLIPMSKGSIIISTRAPVGYVAVLEEAATFNQGCKGLIPKDLSKIFSEFYCYYLLSKEQRLQNLSSGSTFKELSKVGLENFHIPLPPLPEQKKIAEILSTVDKRLELLRKKKEKLERVKKGLMNELLSGRKRVKV